MATAEDDIIKKRLLIEGDSGNEDRLINKLIRNFVKWSNSVISNEGNLGSGEANNSADEENADHLYEQMTASLSNVEFGLLRNKMIFDMNKMEQGNYEVLYQKINSEIEKAKKKIVEKKIELKEARKIRKNRQEYDILARQIQNYPEREQMQNTIKNLEKKVEHLKKTDAENNKKLELRRKQFGVVLQSLSSLKSMIETDYKLDEVMNIGGSAINDDAVAPDVSLNPLENNDTKTARKQINGDEMDREVNSSNSHKREKHYTVAEVEMEEVN